MKFRKKARGWWWPKLMLSLPLSWRRKLANSGRKVSQKNHQSLSAEIMDVTPSEVIKVMQKYDVNYFIHGHTHRPKVHQFDIDEIPRQRIVLGDWYDQGSILLATPERLSLQFRPFFSDKI